MDFSTTNFADIDHIHEVFKRMNLTNYDTLIDINASFTYHDSYSYIVAIQNYFKESNKTRFVYID